MPHAIVRYEPSTTMSVSEQELEKVRQHLQHQVTALKGLVVAILCYIGNVDRAGLIGILDDTTLLTDRMDIFPPELESIQVEINHITNDLRKSISAE